MKEIPAPLSNDSLLETPTWAKSLPWLPATALSGDPYDTLHKILHRSPGGGLRDKSESLLLARAVDRRDVVIDDLVLPWRPAFGYQDIVERLLGPTTGTETELHRQLKVCATLLAKAIDPSCVLEHESPITDETCPVRPDIVAWSAYGHARSFECGATTGRSILEQLDASVIGVAVLPYAGIEAGFLRGYVFRKPDNPMFGTVSFEASLAAWAAVRDLGRLTSPNAPRIGGAAL